MRKFILPVFLLLFFASSADAYYYGSKGYSSTYYPGSIAGGIDSKNYSSSSDIKIAPSASTSAAEVKKYCQGNKYDKDQCGWSCSDLQESHALSSEYAYEKNLCVETQCAKSDSKSDGEYATSCGLACSEIDDKNVKCVRRDIEKYCRDSFDETKCGRYCAKAANKHTLCADKQYSKSFVESEDCNKYCNRSSKNFSDSACKEKCGGMFDRYNTEEKNKEIKIIEEKESLANDTKKNEVTKDGIAGNIENIEKNSLTGFKDGNTLVNGAIIKKENESTILEKDGFQVSLDKSLPLEVKEGVMYVGNKEISVSPDVVATSAKSLSSDVIKNISLVKIDNEYVYSLDVVKKEKVLAFYPVEIKTSIFYGTKDGKIVKESKNFSNKILDWLSF